MGITKEIMSDINGNLSSKRLVTFVSLALIVAGYVANLAYGKVVDENMFNSVMYIVVAGLGFTGAEQFAPARVQ
jgi:hypothetical protein